MNEDIMCVVAALNGQICDCTDDSEFIGFVFTSNGTCDMVSFVGQDIWCSEDDTRDWDAVKHEYEPMGDFLIKEANKIINKTNKILWR